MGPNDLSKSQKNHDMHADAPPANYTEPCSIEELNESKRREGEVTQFCKGSAHSHFTITTNPCNGKRRPLYELHTATIPTNV